MKKISLIVLLALFSCIFTKTIAQVAEAFNYQAVVRDNQGKVISNQAISLRISLVQNEQAVFVETHAVTTNTFGLIAIAIGQGTKVSGAIDEINWQGGLVFLQVEIDPAGGINYVISETSELRSVPYSMLSAYSEKMEGGTINGTSIGSTIASTGVFTKLTLSDVLKITPRSSQPTNPTEGEIYINSDDHKIYCYLNGYWQKLLTELVPGLPKVVTNDIFNIAWNSAEGGGEVTADGGTDVTNRGLCWSTSENPTIQNSKTLNGAGLGVYTTIIPGLEPQTTYYVRAYATNSLGTSYGEQRQMVTAEDHTEAGSFTDPRDGNNYNFVTIGDQVWMAENLAYLPSVSPSVEKSETEPRFYVYDYNGTDAVAARASAFYSTYGTLYNWEAAKTACPSGWHLPSDEEWKILEKYLGMSSLDADNTGWRNSGLVGKRLKSQTGWQNNGNGTDSEGFKALPSGSNSANMFYGLGQLGIFWSSSPYESSEAWGRTLTYEYLGVRRFNDLRNSGYTVRCLKDAIVTVPAVTTADITNITHNSADGGGEVTADGGAEVSGRGVCWSITENPTLANNKTLDGTGTGSFGSRISGLTPNTTYYVRAYATNEMGTAYGEAKQFTSGDGSISGSFTDSRDGKSYDYVLIGTQTWMAENLAFLPSVCDSYSGSSTEPLFYVYGYSGTSISEAKANENFSIYGVLYNWQATVSACPDGWHMPSDEEWSVLTNFLGSDAGLKMKSISGWSDNGNGDNNSKFNALPAGQRSSYGGFYQLGNKTYLWSSTKAGTAAWCQGLYKGSTEVTRYSVPASEGYSVRCLKNEGQSSTVPTVTTAELTTITQSSADGGGEVTDDGGATVTVRGVCWSTTENPTTADSNTMDGTGTGSFTSNLTGLEPNSTYFVRAYATNSVGTAYGEQKQFITEDEGGGLDSFTDSRDGNSYEYVTIGTQTWMAENLAYLPAVSGSQMGSVDDPHYYVYDYQGTDISAAIVTENYSTYGSLYNWEAANLACPVGWHLPSDAEWKTLEQYLGMSSTNADGTGMRNSGDVGHKLKSKTGWDSDGNGSDSEGFKALPGGVCSSGGVFSGIGSNGLFWSSSQLVSSDAWIRGVVNYSIGVNRYSYSKSYGFLVRCLKDEGQSPTVPTVATAELTNITQSSAAGGGEVTVDGGAAVTARGVCWSMTESPTTTDNKTMDGTGTGTFTSSLTSLDPNSTYYVRAYATNSVGTAYGDQKQLTTEDESVSGSFTDSRDGNSYDFVTIGTQTWMAENIAYLPSVNSPDFGYDFGSSYYVYGYDGTSVSSAKASSNYEIYGVLYNWEAANYHACPEGWHIPSDQEWVALEIFLGMNSSESTTTGWRNSGSVGNMLKSNSGWSNNGSGNNSSNFNVLPGGTRYYEGGFSNLGDKAYFWSSSVGNGNSAYHRLLSSNYDGLNRESYSFRVGYSVRCVKD